MIRLNLALRRTWRRILLIALVRRERELSRQFFAASDHRAWADSAMAKARRHIAAARAERARLHSEIAALSLEIEDTA